MAQSDHLAGHPPRRKRCRGQRTSKKTVSWSTIRVELGNSVIYRKQHLPSVYTIKRVCKIEFHQHIIRRQSFEVPIRAEWTAASQPPGVRYRRQVGEDKSRTLVDYYYNCVSGSNKVHWETINEHHLPVLAVSPHHADNGLYVVFLYHTLQSVIAVLQHAGPQRSQTAYLIMPPPVGKGAISVAFVRPSSRLSVRRVHSE